MGKLFLKRMSAFYLNIFLHPSHLLDFSTIFWQSWSSTLGSGLKAINITSWNSSPLYFLPEIQALYTSSVAQLVKNLPAKQEAPANSWVGKICWRKDRLPTPAFLGFPCDSAGKESACNAGDLVLIPGLGRFPGGRHGNLLQYSFLENPHGQRSLAGTISGFAKSWTWQSD